MCAAVVMRSELTVREPKSWIEAHENLYGRVREAAKHLHDFRELKPEDFDGIETEKPYGGDNLMISLNLTNEELTEAPQSIRMLMNDLGIADSDNVALVVELGGVSRDIEWHHAFSFTIKPEEVNEERIGITLPSRGVFNVFAPTRREFDGVHQYVDAYYGRGDKVYEFYVNRL